MKGARIIVDLDAATFLDSAGIHAIVIGYHDAIRAGSGLAIGPASPRVARVLALVGLGDGLTAEPAGQNEPTLPSSEGRRWACPAGRPQRSPRKRTTAPGEGDNPGGRCHLNRRDAGRLVHAPTPWG
jgi:hypothetical protein